MPTSEGQFCFSKLWTDDQTLLDFEPKKTVGANAFRRVEASPSHPLHDKNPISGTEMLGNRPTRSYIATMVKLGLAPST